MLPYYKKTVFCFQKIKHTDDNFFPLGNKYRHTNEVDPSNLFLNQQKVYTVSFNSEAY